MDELERFKKQWQSQDDLPSYKEEDLYQMMHKKSSSIVKWIFIISIIEFAFWITLELLMSSQETDEIIQKMSLNGFYRVSLIINYVVIIGFIILFFMNYKAIKTTDSTRGLMKNILKTRRTVKLYVWFNILFFSLSFLVSIIMTIQHYTNFNTKQFWISIGISVVVLIVIVLLFLLFYRVVYGVLTRRLKRNYNNLKQIEL